jgi:hypothetical protein
VWKIIREILALIWKLLRTLLKDKLRAILKRIAILAVLVIAVVAVVVFVLTQVLG